MTQQPTLHDVLAPIQPDLHATNDVIRERLQSRIALVNQIGDYIVNAGGKRLRPALVLLMARALGVTRDDLAHAHVLAAVIEFIHTATLLHDDVVDESDLRRGRRTANAEFGNAAPVLVGDFLYSRAFQMMVGVGRLRIMDVLADATNTIAEGEVLQLLNCSDPNVTEAGYFRVIEYKTAKLFEAAARVAAVLAGLDAAQEQRYGQYGLDLGIAFQLTDDALDYDGNAADLGKQVGDDLREGKPTLPLIHALAHAGPDECRTIREAIEAGGTTEVGGILNIIQACGSLTYTRQRAAHYAQRAATALHGLPASEYSRSLLQLCDVAVNRNV
ncbi:MAG: polyprenyl synthetase family protein [Burkholderiaceae bacterium]